MDGKNTVSSTTGDGCASSAQGASESTGAGNADYMGAWGDDIPDFMKPAAPEPKETKPVKKAKGKGKAKKTRAKPKKAPVAKPPKEELKLEELPKSTPPAPTEAPFQQPKESKIPKSSEKQESQKSEESSKPDVTITTPSSDTLKETESAAEAEETPEETKKRLAKEKRAHQIDLLEKQIAEEESMMFGWDNLEETMEKQMFIDSLKEDLAALKNPNKKRKKKKKAAPKNSKNLMVNIFKPQMSKNTIVKEQLIAEKSVYLCNDPTYEISNIKLDKLQKGMFNRSNNCFVNVILQTLFSIPVFYNFITHFGEQVEQNELLKEIFTNNSDDNLLIANFLELAKCFHPETGGIKNMLHYGDKIINVEEIFRSLLMNFNPDRQQQDCHEFLGLMLDTLNNEINEILEKVGISTKNKTLKDSSNDPATEEWEETGKKKLKIKNRAEDLIKNSPIFEIFGGCMREDINVEGKNNNSARVQPYLYLSLPITMDCSIDSSLKQYFEPEELEGFRLGKKDAYATKKQSLLTIPNILILHVKRFIYTDRAVKTGENIYYPDILELQDEYFAPELQEKRKAARKKWDEAEKAKKDKEEKKVEASVEEEKKGEKSAKGSKGKKGKKSKEAPSNGVKVSVIEQSEDQKQEMLEYKHLEKYELIATIVHKGTSVQKGHYITFVKDNFGNWILYDDKECKKVTQNLALDQQAYVLVYRYLKQD